MGEYIAEKVVNLMKTWIGLKKSDGSYKTILDIYNSQKVLPRGHKMTTSDAWCAATVSACAIKLGYESIIPPECSCNQMIQLFKRIGEWVEDESVTPKPGWVVFYDWDDTSGIKDNLNRADHVGIVEKVENGVITVIEGNYSNSVKRRTVAINGKYLRGYGVPKYTADKQVADPKPSVTHVYTVMKGDIPEKIAKAFGVTVKELIDANRSQYPTITKDYIRIGWRLVIPIKKESGDFVPYVAKVTTKSGLNVRRNPDMSSEKLGALEYGKEVNVLGENGSRDWGMILYKNSSAWISLAYTKKV